MSFDAVEQVVKAVLYEGYLLYPYRASAVKNRRRWIFGGLFPRAYAKAQTGADAWTVRTECLVTGTQPRVEISVRFLHLATREVGRLRSPLRDPTTHEWPEYKVVESLEVGEQTYYTWQGAIERDVRVDSLLLDTAGAGESSQMQKSFEFSADREIEFIADSDGDVRSVIVRNQEAIQGAVDVSWKQPREDVFKICVAVRNETVTDAAPTAARDDALPETMASTHIVLHAADGQFVSLTNPPDSLRPLVANCKNIGVWPVLVGDAERRDLMLVSPIILYDFPQIAAESAGELFDATEIDEILTLRIQTLSDDEKRQSRDLDERARTILDRTESLPPEHLAKLHGVIRGLRQLQH
jgi:hydrogenase maturation protease